MTEAQIEVIRALADNSMNVSKTAKAMGKKPATIHAHITAVRNKTGKDPLDFRDLNALLKMAERQKDAKKVFVCTCKICGARFEAPDHHYRLCGDECRAKAKAMSKARENGTRAGYMKEYRRHMMALDSKYEPKKKPAPAMTLAEASRRAREMGMSYGEYMVHLRECRG